MFVKVICGFCGNPMFFSSSSFEKKDDYSTFKCTSCNHQIHERISKGLNDLFSAYKSMQVSPMFDETIKDEEWGNQIGEGYAVRIISEQEYAQAQHR